MLSINLSSRYSIEEIVQSIHWSYFFKPAAEKGLEVCSIAVYRVVYHVPKGSREHKVITLEFELLDSVFGAVRASC